MAEGVRTSERLAELEREIGHHQVVQQRLSDAKASLDRELQRFRVIQRYVKKAVFADTLEAFYKLTTEAVVEAFEFEVALFLRSSGGPGKLRVVAAFGFELDPTGQTLPFDVDVAASDSLLLKPGNACLDQWSSLDLVDAVLCPYRDKDGGFGGVIVGGKTRQMQHYHDDVDEEIRSSFANIVGQAGALMANQELASEIRAQNQTLEELSKSYSRFVPFGFLQLLDRDSIQAVLPGDHAGLDMTVLYADLRDFTSLSETFGPAKTFALLNDFLAIIEPSIANNGGFINHFQGDAITALFPNGADAAFTAAKDMWAALRTFNVVRSARGEELLRMGIGINSGELMLGAIGGMERMDVNVVGDAVNLTARTEGLTKLFGANCILTEFAVQRLKEPERFALRELDRAIVSGRSDSVRIYELIDCDDADVRQSKLLSAPSFARGLDLYRNGDFAKAIGAFVEVLGSVGGDSAAGLYIQRCAELVSNPPKRRWDGVTVIDRK